MVLVLFCSQALMGQQTVSGSVSDSDGPLPGATVIVQGTDNGVTTDLDGNFSIQASEGDVLELSYVGFQTQTFTISANQDTVSVVLEADNELEEVVVTGYGTQKKINLTGAVAAVSGEVLDDRPIVNVGEGLQGVIPNLNIDIRNGDPTTDPVFNIRGFESINGGTPLIVDNVLDIEVLILMILVSVLKIFFCCNLEQGDIRCNSYYGKERRERLINFTSEFAWGKPIMRMDPIDDPLSMQGKIWPTSELMGRHHMMTIIWLQH